LPEPGERKSSLEAVVVTTVRAAPHRPTVEVIFSLPQIRPSLPGAVQLYERAASEAIGEDAQPRRGVGQPRRNAYVSAEVAVMLDIERRPTTDPLLDAEGRDERRRLKGWKCPRCGQRVRLARVRHSSRGTVAMLVCPVGHRHPEPGAVGPFSTLDYLGPRAASEKTVDRWRNDGRAFLAQLGVWPWALVSNGRLGRVWWRDRRFSEELAAWREGRIPAVHRMP
jgi:hypothetical protein